MFVFFYLLSIVLANIITAGTQPLQLGVFLIPMGSFLIGATFVFRDFVQMQYGRKKTYLYIFLAFILSGFVSFMLGDPLNIVMASVLSFLVSETTDTELFTRLRASLETRIVVSGVVGGSLDSAIFVIVGLSPIGAGFIPWEAVPFAILGQVIVKTVMQMFGALSFNALTTRI